MLKQFTKDKVYVFIDGANIFYTQKHLGWSIGRI
ncbi:NYN domain-containing protein [Candidatus Roizmanbacteria bacterium]|nr:NYN domain-containing protein [Candidatus Roizmanbacteria bacterium]